MIKNWIDVVKRKWLYFIAYVYLLSSVLIFMLGNIKLIISIPISILLIWAFKRAIYNCPDVNMQIFQKKKVLIGVFLILFIWVILSGIGGFVWQNTWDHKFRNAVYTDLVEKSWPVIEGKNALCYYLGFWLPSALVGKLFGLIAGYGFQIIWAFLGVVIAFFMICQYLKSMKISNVIIFVLYSGLDVFLFYIFSQMSFHEATVSMFKGIHIELITNYFNSSSNTTLIFWLYNQIIPFWVGMMLLLLQKNNKSTAFIFAILLLYAPFPLVALVPVVIYMIFKEYDSEEYVRYMEKYQGLKSKTIKLLCKIKMACTLENFSSILIVTVIGLFFLSNIAVSKIGLLPINHETIYRYLLYIIFEFGIYIIFIYKNNYRNWILNILLITTLLLPFIKLGNGCDFAARTCIPLAFYIMILLMQELQRVDLKDWKKILILLTICLGAVTPITEMIRTINNESLVLKGKIEARSDSLISVFIKEKNECYDNFIATTDSIFYRYLVKQPKK